MTTFNELTFFHADINQPEVEDSLQQASDQIKSVPENVNKSKAVNLHSRLTRGTFLVVKHSENACEQFSFAARLAKTFCGSELVCTGQSS